MNLEKIKKVLIIISTIIFCSFVGYEFGLSQSGNFLKSIIEPGSMVTEASYVIFTDGSTVYARYGTTGEIVKTSINASEVIQYAIDQLTNGGKIFIKAGKYDLEATILINKPGISLQGSYGATWLMTNLNIPIIKVVRPTGNINLGSKISDLVLKGPGRAYLNAHCIYVDDTWGLDLENLVIGDCRHGIHIWKTGIKLIKNIMIEPIGEWGLGNCYRGIFQDQNPPPDTFAGLLSMWSDIDIGYCESDAIYIKKIDSIWANNIRLIESGGHGLRADGSTAASNFANIQIDCMHGDALHLGDNPYGWKFYDTMFVGGTFCGAPSSSTGFSTFGIPSGLGGYGLWLKNGERVTFSDTELGLASNGKPVWIEDSWWTTISSSNVRSSVELDGITINSSSGTKIESVNVDANSLYSTTGIHYVGNAPYVGTKIIGSSTSNYNTPIDVSIDPNAVVIASP